MRDPLINSAGDGLPLLVILNLLRIDFLLVKGKNFAGDDLQLQLAGDKPVGEDNSVGEYTDEEITLWGRDALLRIPLINSVEMNYRCW